jgi:uncharacterized protein
MATVPIRLTPRAGRDAIEGVGVDGSLRVRVAAAPVDGAANHALVQLLADALAMPISGVRIIAGERGRHKRVAIDDLDEATLAARWPGVDARR